MRQETLASNVLFLLEGICWEKPVASNWEPNGARLKIIFEPNIADMRFCMGEGGRCIKGLQFVAGEIGRRNDYSVNIRLIQGLRGVADKVEHEFEQNLSFNHDDIVKVAGDMLASSIGRRVKLKIKRENDLLSLRSEVKTPEENQALLALGEPLYSYGYRHGCIIKLAAL